MDMKLLPPETPGLHRPGWGHRGDQIARLLPSTLRRAEGLDCTLRGDLDVVDVLIAAVTMIREPVGCQERGRA
jgi:hypothetical protein